MKASFILSALASTAIAAPLSLPAIPNLGDLLGNKLPVVSDVGGLNNVLGGVLGNLGGKSGLPLEGLLGGLTGILGNSAGNLPTGNTGANLPQASGPSAAAPSAAAPSAAAPSAGGSSGKLLQDLAPQLNNVLTVTGPNAKTLLIQLSPQVTSLVSGLGLPGLGVPLGGIVASASSVGDLVTALGPQVEGLVTVVADGVGALVVQLSPQVAGLVSGLGLPTVGAPVGTVLATVGNNL